MALFQKQKNKTKKETAPVATAGEVKALRPLALSGRVLLRKPWTSEKAHSLQSQNQYVFLVSIRATKPEIRKAVAHRYNVRVGAVNVVIQKGKTKRLGRSLGERSDFKKAVVTLAPGQKIEIT